jgi:cell wall-active antibiotic response 4TMS protein YvqF
MNGDEIQTTERDPRNVKRALWGVFLILLGCAFLMERMGYLGDWVVGQLWPAVFWVIAIAHVIERRPGSAIMFVLLGTWFFACTLGWWGLTYGNSWGLVLVAVGAGMVVRALTGEDARRRAQLLKWGERHRQRVARWSGADYPQHPLSGGAEKREGEGDQS